MARKNEWLRNTVINTDDGTRFTLKYYISRTGTENGPVFGVSVEKYAGDGALAESETTPPFSESREEAAGLAACFARNSVTPCALLETLDECIG